MPKPASQDVVLVTCDVGMRRDYRRRTCDAGDQIRSAIGEFGEAAPVYAMRQHQRDGSPENNAASTVGVRSAEAKLPQYYGANATSHLTPLLPPIKQKKSPSREAGAKVMGI
jgi:hypothetical protein